MRRRASRRGQLLFCTQRKIKRAQMLLGKSKEKEMELGLASSYKY
jgi:hypothetical protein